ncbi:unnamed protein product [Parnassius apollo]|uniref:(apollo) hypothetical protein n=1 Tax=Parnassius apollo TaxID=110799 RepID=A0A8S3WR36_PARAO|nr:unnamed protein product [Parnassius apollo]
MPRLAIANGLKFPDIPDVLNELTSMEERLVSPPHVFLKIVRRGQGLGYQHGLSGNVINVPVKINNMVKALPRSINDDNVITVELKRKFCYKHGRKEQVRPEIIRRAAEYLVTCELFRTYGIELEGSWTNNEPEDTVECTCSSPEQESNVDEIPDVNPGGTETLLDENQDLTIVMAPEEGERPISLLFDRHLEELAFIKVHCAIERKYLVNLSHSEVTRSEISRNDRRAVRPDYLFTALKKQQTIAVKNNVTTCLRKKTVRGAPVFASNVLQNNFVDNLVQHDDGYRVLGGIRNSPAHWESEKKLLAMVRQFGVPTLFLTISAAEVQWIPLLILLSEVVDKKKLTELEAENLPYDTKTRLIQSDPSTYFEIKLKEIQKTWSCSSGPFLNYKITHFYYRIEFQHRGSPHAHMMLWLDEAPTFVPGDTASAYDISKFVDNIISCNNTEVPDALRRRPTSDRLCRSGLPFFPLDKTKVLIELSKDDPEFKKSKQLAKDICQKIQNITAGIYTFVDFLDWIRADRGMSRLLREALDEAKKGNKSVKDSLRTVSNVFLNSSEISAQEAIYVLTGLPLSRASEAAMYINTSLPQERVHILKSYLELQSLEPDSSDIFQKGIIDYYSKRPLSLENISLSRFVAYYTYSKKTHSASSIETLNDSSQAIDYSQAVEEVEAEGNWISLQDNLGYIQKRTKTRVIRFRRYSYIDDLDNFYREQIMLYIPW